MKFLYVFFVLNFYLLSSQTSVCELQGKIVDINGKGILNARVGLSSTLYIATTDSNGSFKLKNISPGSYKLSAIAAGFLTKTIQVNLPHENNITLSLLDFTSSLDEIVVTGNLKETAKDESAVNIDIITPKLFQKTATPNLFEATGMVNGVKPQINCNVCNTGDIHINGMEGPYTLILIDGMPIVSGLSSVYGLMGIPASMIERLEIAKGPSGALFGSEAMGGTINLITKNPLTAPKFYLDYYGTSYLENNLDMSTKFRLGKKVDWLIGTNVYWYDNIVDRNNDNFTDVTLQKRFSLFNKLNFKRKNNKEFSIAGRYVYEDRWGGQTNWTKEFRGGDSIYGESIFAKRTEFISKYQWPTKEKIFSQVSYNFHDQNSVYGQTPFLAKQSTGFFQTYWNKELNQRNDFLLGVSYKNLWFDDNTVATLSIDGKSNIPENTNTFGLFVQNEALLDSLGKHKLLVGARLDYNDVYKLIPSPRIAYKWSPNYKYIFRLNFGTGFRIVNVFTEDHAALTGAREVVFKNKIKPERSYNGSFNMIYKMKVSKGSMLIWDGSLFYYYFTNKIVANNDLDPNKVIFDNLSGFAFSRGVSLNASLASTSNFKYNIGISYMDVQNVSMDDIGKLSYSRQLHAPQWSGNLNGGYTFVKSDLKLDVTANWYGPQRLPILPHDFRPAYSPWFCILNLQLSKKIAEKYDCYLGVKNILNFVPQNPIMRPQDPFDKRVNDTENNPNGYTFDPSYNYAPIQGIRAYLGIRITI